MKRILSIPSGWVLTALIAAMLGGCVDDRYTEKALSGDGVQLLVELNVPGVSTAAVRSLEESTEKHIDKLDVLVFEVDDSSGAETFAYKKAGELVSGTTYKVTLENSVANETYRFVFLANLHTEVEAAKTAGDLAVGTPKEDALAAITFDVWTTANDPKPWNTTTTPPRYLPMWGESANAYKVDANLYAIPNVSMLRSVARVDILMNPTDTSTPSSPNATGFNGNFTLTGVKVYNASSRGAAAPVAEVNDLPADVGSTGVTLPSVPSPNPQGTIEYEYSDLSDLQKKQGMFHDIYIAESANTKIVDSKTVNIDESEMTCVVVAIADATNTSTWYRLDFIKDQTTGLRWDILRNYCYTFKIKSINGAGYANAEEAFDADPVNLEYEMEVSHDLGNNEITEVVFNGQYMLGVSQEKFLFSPSARTYQSDDNTLSVTTTYGKGWKVVKIVDGQNADINTANGGWLGVTFNANNSDFTGTATANAEDTPTNIKIKLAERNSYEDRTGYIHLSAGRLTYEVEVIQATIWAGSNIYWNGTTLTFDDVYDHEHETYQGVYFKWGSLWGISPSGDYWEGGVTPVYKPNTYNTGYMKDTISMYYENIPYWNLQGSISDDRDRKYLAEVHKDDDNRTNGYGDICKNLTDQAPDRKLHGKTWRMPTSKECEYFSTPYNADAADYELTEVPWYEVVTTKADGTTSISNGAHKHKAVGTPFFPAAGYRLTEGSVGQGSLSSISSIGTLGCYWSASAVPAPSPNSAYAYYLRIRYDITTNTVTMRSTNALSNYANPVRCVVE